MSDQDLTTLRAGDDPFRPGVILVAGDGKLWTHLVTGDEVSIGRAPDCDLVIDHRALSRRHAVLRRGAVVTLQDLGTTNGTRLVRGVLNGGAPVPLAAGESFQIGPFSFLVVAERGAGSRQSGGGERTIVTDPGVDRVAPVVHDIARSPINVLIQGETGVGKDVLAATLHALSERRGPLVRINCAALSESLLESELFGHERGAFTGAVAAREGLLESAAGGTVFLDEVGELPVGTQAKLLRAVENREVVRLGATRPVSVDLRFIAATNRELPAAVAAGRFRHDLYFRLDGMTLRIPPLRERRGQIVPLALEFLAGARAAPETLAALGAHDWPGNVRELKAVLERAVVLARGGEVQPRHLVFGARVERAAVAAAAPAPVVEPAEDLSYLDPDEREDRARIIAALTEAAGNQTRAAKLLGFSRTTMINKLSRYRIARPRR